MGGPADPAATGLTDAEIAYVATQPIGRIATSSPEGTPDVAAVFCTFRPDLGAFLIGGLTMERTRKYHNVRRNPRASIVFDDIASWSPYQPRGLKVSGSASIRESDTAIKLLEEGVPIIVLVPERKWAWGIDSPAFSDDGVYTMQIDGAVVQQATR